MCDSVAPRYILKSAICCRPTDLCDDTALTISMYMFGILFSYMSSLCILSCLHLTYLNVFGLCLKELCRHTATIWTLITMTTLEHTLRSQLACHACSTVFSLCYFCSHEGFSSKRSTRKENKKRNAPSSAVVDRRFPSTGELGKPWGEFNPKVKGELELACTRRSSDSGVHTPHTDFPTTWLKACALLLMAMPLVFGAHGHPHRSFTCRLIC